MTVSMRCQLALTRDRHVRCALPECACECHAGHPERANVDTAERFRVAEELYRAETAAARGRRA